jgi:hypothetical protein
MRVKIRRIELWLIMAGASLLAMPTQWTLISRVLAAGSIASMATWLWYVGEGK